MALKPDSAGTGPNYQKTLIACYMGFITQAIVANFTPLLFLKFHRDFGIPLGRVAAFSTVFYFTQLLVDLFCAKFVDRIGYRKCVVASEALAAAGLVGLAVLPFLLPDPFTALLISVILYAGGAGLIEVLVSPIVEACPFDNKASVMSLLHSFYCWGSVAVILVSTALFAVFGLNSWPFVACLWAVVPFVNLFKLFGVASPSHHFSTGMRFFETVTARDSSVTPFKMPLMPAYPPSSHRDLAPSWLRGRVSP